MHDFPATPTCADIKAFLAACDAELEELQHRMEAEQAPEPEPTSEPTSEPEPQTPDAVLRTLAAKALALYPGEAARIERGLLLALNGAVTLRPDGTATVQSGGKDPEVYYDVGRGLCDCRDFARAPGGRCKHRLAASLVRKAAKLASTPAPAAPEPAPPAPAPEPVTRVAWYATFHDAFGLAICDENARMWFQGDDDVMTQLGDEAWPYLHLHGQLDVIADQRLRDIAAGTDLSKLDALRLAR